jgi:hypothetical protein
MPLRELTKRHSMPFGPCQGGRAQGLAAKKRQNRNATSFILTSVRIKICHAFRESRHKKRDKAMDVNSGVQGWKAQRKEKVCRSGRSRL